MELWAVYMFPFMTSCFNTRTNQPSTGNLFRTTSYFGIILYTQFLVKLKLAWYGLFKDICSHSKKVSNLLLQQASSILKTLFPFTTLFLKSQRNLSTTIIPFNITYKIWNNPSYSTMTFHSKIETCLIWDVQRYLQSFKESFKFTFATSIVY